jgi:hypothetical protein
MPASSAREDAVVAGARTSCASGRAPHGEERCLELACDVEAIAAPPVRHEPLAAATDRRRVHAKEKTMARVAGEIMTSVAGDGHATRIISSVDLRRALVALPVKHPSTCPHDDAELGTSWSDPSVLADEHVDAAPEFGGVVVLSIGGDRRTETDVWVEPCAALRTRLAELLAIPQEDAPALARILQRRDLRFRCAVVSDPARREAIAKTIRARIEHVPLPRDAAQVASQTVQR